jgi:hypothetical protein
VNRVRDWSFLDTASLLLSPLIIKIAEEPKVSSHVWGATIMPTARSIFVRHFADLSYEICGLFAERERKPQLQINVSTCALDLSNADHAMA